jgi:type IV pilus assembly protein PilA
MVVVAILGILAAVAVPAFQKYSRRSKTAEAEEMLAYIFRQGAVYYTAERPGLQGVGSLLSSQCVPDNAGPTPPAPPVQQRRSVDFPTAFPTWEALQIHTGDALYFIYYLEVTGGTSMCSVRAADAFTARAEGDQDQDGIRSIFERAAYANANAEIQGSPGLYMMAESE